MGYPENLKFDNTGNMITKKPKSEVEKTFKCKYCKFEYDSKSARAGHEQWCDNNPNNRKTNPLNSIKSKPITKTNDKKGNELLCQYCESKWDSKASRTQHERWCDNNPNKREYRKTKPEKPEEPKEEIIIEDNYIIKELKDFDRVFGLTDKQIVKYIREKIKSSEHKKVKELETELNRIKNGEHTVNHNKNI